MTYSFNLVLQSVERGEYTFDFLYIRIGNDNENYIFVKYLSNMALLALLPTFYGIIQIGFETG